jgi:hypothetical protein
MSPLDKEQKRTPGPLAGMKLYRLLEPMPVELDWLMQHLGPLGVTLAPLTLPAPTEPGALYLYNSTQRMELPAEFLARVRSAGGCGLLHLGDEYFRSNLTNYAAFDFVVRMLSAAPINVPGIFPLALGLTNNLGPPVTTPASERPLTWFFAGDWKADRNLMANAFRHLPGGFLSMPKSFYGQRGISRADYLSKLASSRFAPSPAGNVCIETCRPYEALHFGAIPLLPKTRFADTYRDLFGSHPLPTFYDWEVARRFAEAQLKSPRTLDTLQSECLDWWAKEQVLITNRLEAFIAEGRAGAFRGSLQSRFADRGLGKFERMQVLLGQQSPQRLMTRAGFAVERIGYKLRTGKRLSGEWSIQDPPSPPPGRAEPQGVQE